MINGDGYGGHGYNGDVMLISVNHDDKREGGKWQRDSGCGDSYGYVSDD